MKRMIVVPVTTLLLVGSTTAQGQSMEQVLQAAINADGHRCEAVTATNPIAAINTGGAMLGVACSGGEQYAVEVSAEAAIVSVTRCSTFEVVANMSCF